MGSLFDAVIAATDASVNYTSYDTILIVTPRVVGPPAAAAWPEASIGKWGPYTTADGSIMMAWISCVNDWGQQPGNDREIFETISHEFGRNLGLGDQYTPAVTGRNPGSWELMDWGDPHPHLTVAHWMKLGWVRPDRQPR